MKEQSRNAARQPKIGLTNRMDRMETCMRAIQTKLDELIHARLGTDGEDDENCLPKKPSEANLLKIGPWRFDVAKYPQLSADLDLRTALGLIFRRLSVEKVVPVSWESRDDASDNLVRWLMQLSGTHYHAFTMGEEALILVESPAGSTDKSKVLLISEVLRQISDEDM